MFASKAALFINQAARQISQKHCCGRASEQLPLLTTQTQAFFDETVKRHIASLEKEIAVLESEAEGLAREIEELTGGVPSDTIAGAVFRASAGSHALGYAFAINDENQYGRCRLKGG